MTAPLEPGSSGHLPEIGTGSTQLVSGVLFIYFQLFLETGQDTPDEKTDWRV